MNIEGCKIWLTGSRGFIGSELAFNLDKICELTRISNRKNEDANQISINPIHINFQSKNEIKKRIKELGIPDIFIHLGWGDMTNPHSSTHLEENVIQSKNLIEELYKEGLERFVFLGSMNEYGDRIGTLDEKMNSKGWITNYAKGKILVAKFGFEKAKMMNKKFIHIRLFYTYGPKKKGGSLIQDIYQSHKNKKNVSLGTCEQYRDYIYVSDVVKGIMLLSGSDNSHTVNLGSGNAIQLKEFVKKFWDELKGDQKMLHFGEKQVGKEQAQPNCFANLEKLENITGWKPTTSIENGIKKMIKELQKNESF